MVKLIISFIWALLSVKTVLYWVYLWQLKEFRLDRVRSHFRFELEPKVFLPFLPRRLFRPKLTARALLIVFLSVLTVLAAGAVVFFKIETGLIGYLFYLTLIERASLLFTSVFVLVSFPPVFLRKEQIYRQAKRKVRTSFSGKVVGITGSYGKTSAKEFTAAILSERFKVSKTQGNNNTKIGVAQDIIREIMPDTQVFVAEMGAYKKGEIADLTRLIQPQMAIVTGINSQHLDIFGSFQKLKEAKYEIVEALPRGGVAIFNADNKHCLKMADRADRAGKKVVVYSTNKNKKKTPHEIFYAEVVSSEETGTSLRIIHKGRDFIIDAPVAGVHQAENILAAVVVAKKMGLSDKEVIAGARKLQAPPQALRIIKSKKMVIVDDSYSANPDGFIAALKTLASFKIRKVVVTRGMIELGKAEAESHRKVARQMRGKIDKLILLNERPRSYFESELKGIDPEIVVEGSPDRVYEEIVSAGDPVAVLIESRVPARLKKLLGFS